MVRSIVNVSVFLATCGVLARSTIATERRDPSAIPGLDSAIRQAFRGWVVDQVAEGDLNGDARPDVVATFKRPDEEREARESPDSAWESRLAVFLRTESGALTLHTKARKAVCLRCGGMKAAPGEVVGTPSISAKGILLLDYEGGSREIWHYQLKWRYDKGSDRFALIGETLDNEDTLSESGEMERGELSHEDINYLSGKLIWDVAGQGRRICDIKPRMRAPDLAKFDFESRNQDDKPFVPGSCRRQ